MKRKIVWSSLGGLLLAVIAGVSIYQGVESEKTQDKVVKEKTRRELHVASDNEFRNLPSLSPEVLAVIDPKAEGKRMVRSLPDNLSLEDRRGIYHYLKNGPNNDQEYTIKNDLMNKLRNQKEFPSELANELMSLVEDPRQDMTVRIYALQHLRPVYEQTGDSAVRELFYRALDETENEIAGGALLALRRLLSDYPEEFDQALISRKAAEIATNSAVNDLTRTSAIQVAVMLGQADEIAPALRELASSEGTPLPLRLSAIAGIGSLRDPTDRVLLEQLTTSSGPESRAARAALAKL